jgi:hypothetical protein
MPLRLLLPMARRRRVMDANGAVGGTARRRVAVVVEVAVVVVVVVVVVVGLAVAVPW